MLRLVVLPGLDATGLLHGAFCQAAHQHFDAVQVIAYPANRFLDYAELQAHVRSRLPADAPFVLLAESFSGPVGLHIAAQPPAMMRALVLSTSFASSPRPMLQPLAGMLNHLALPMPPLGLLLPYLLGRWATPTLRQALAHALAQVKPAVLRQRAAMALQADAASALPHIHLPVLDLRATEDRLLSAACQQRIRQGIAHTQTRTLPGPHLLLQTAPTQAADAVGGFAAALPEQAATSSSA